MEAAEERKKLKIMCKRGDQKAKKREKNEVQSSKLASHSKK